MANRKSIKDYDVLSDITGQEEDIVLTGYKMSNATTKGVLASAFGGGANITEVMTQLAETTQQINDLVDKTELNVKYQENEVTTRFQSDVKPIITFVSDDGHSNDWNLLKPIFTTEGVPCVLSIVTNRIGTGATRLTYEQLLELQNIHGWEITSHTHTHPNPDGLLGLTLEEAEYELSESYRLLNSNGIKCKNFCIPHGKINSSIREIAQKYYRGIRGSIYGYNYVNDIENLNLKSRPMEFTDILKAKEVVDTVVDTNGWGIFLFHSYAIDGTPEQLVNLQDTIQYAKSLGVEIVTLEEGMNRYANVIEAGDGNLRVTQKGEILSKQITTLLLERDSVTNDSLATTFKDDTCSIAEIPANRLNFPEGYPGVLYTYKYGTSAIGWYQIYVCTSDYRNIYRRDCSINGTWRSWRLISNLSTETLSMNKVDGNTSYLYFDRGRITLCDINNVGSSTFPESKPGQLTVNRIGPEAGYCFQEYRVYGTNRSYKRYATGDGTWSPWVNTVPIVVGVQLDKNEVTNLSIPTDFTVGKISYCILSSDNPSRPLSRSGLLITNRLDTDYGYTYQEYLVYGSNTRYIRAATSNTTWSPWVQISLGGTGTTVNRPVGATVGYSYFDTTLGKPIWLKTSPDTWVDSTGTVV